MFYIIFDSKPEDIANYLVIVNVDRKTYGEKLGYANNYFGLGKGATHNTDIDFVKTDSWSAHDGSEVDVTGKDITFSIVKYPKAVSVDTLNQEIPESILEPVTVSKGKTTSFGAINAIEGASVEISMIEHGIEGVYTLPESYTPNGRLLNSKGGVVATTPGRFEITVSGNKETLKFSGGFTQNVSYTYEARVKKDNTTTVIETTQFILQGE